jgi:hypothetical protein
MQSDPIAARIAQRAEEHRHLDQNLALRGVVKICAGCRRRYVYYPVSGKNCANCDVYCTDACCVAHVAAKAKDKRSCPHWRQREQRRHLSRGA